MSKDKTSGNGKLAVGAAIGAVAGVVTGLLFAPKSGKETRKDIADTAVKAKEKVLAEAKHAEVELRKIADRVEDEARKHGKNLSKAAEDAMSRAKTARDDLVARVKELGDDEDSEKQLKRATKNAEQAKKELEKLLKK